MVLADNSSLSRIMLADTSWMTGLIEGDTKWSIEVVVEDTSGLILVVIVDATLIIGGVGLTGNPLLSGELVSNATWLIEVVVGSIA